VKATQMVRAGACNGGGSGGGVSDGMMARAGVGEVACTCRWHAQGRWCA